MLVVPAAAAAAAVLVVDAQGPPVHPVPRSHFALQQVGAPPRWARWARWAVVLQLAQTLWVARVLVQV